jgi:Tol biopolymer transport system component
MAYSMTSAHSSIEEKMNKLSLFIIVTIMILAALLGACSDLATSQPVSSITATVIPTPTTSTNTATPMRSSKLQITFITNKTDHAEFFGMDVGCTEKEQLCFGTPTLLFKTAPASSNDHGKPMGRIRSYSWSPEGDKIVLSANEDLFIGDMNTQEWENVTDSPDTEDNAPKWSQDGRYIYYLACTQDETGMGSCKLARLDLVEKTNMFLLDSVKDSIATFTVSPDNQSVVFSVSNGFDRLYQSDLDGSNIRELTATDLEETSPTFSSDGRLVAFVRTNRPLMVTDSKLESDIILQNSNWDDEKNLTYEMEGEALAPAFSLDGKWIAFAVFDANNHFNIYAASIDQDVVFPVTQGNDNKVFPSWRQFYE